MKEEQIRAPASYEQVPCLKLLSPYWKREEYEDVRRKNMRRWKCRIYEADSLAYTRQAASHIRGEQRRICETSGLTYTKQAA